MAKGKSSGSGGGLRKLHLVKDKERRDWALKPEGGDRALRRFERKEDATKGGALSDALGKQGGSVRIHKQDGEIQEERTYPGSKDPPGRRG
jgi:hypothetical protein